MIKPFKPANLNQYSSAKSFYLGVKINPTVPVSNSFCEFLKTRSERKKCLIKWLLLSQKHEKGFIWPTPSDSVYTGLDTFFYLFFSDQRLKNEKTEMKILVQKLAHCSLPFKNLHDSASHTVRNKGFWVARGCKVVELRQWSKHVKTDST